MNTYLPDATDFTDMTVKDRPDTRFAGMAGPWAHCPKCRGYGGWNLKLNAYPGDCRCGHPEGRHLHTNLGHVTRCYDCDCEHFTSARLPEQRHFRAFCNQCWGWGWVEANGPDVTCVHTFTEIKADQPWRCWHTIRCTTCGRTRSYDSSD